MAPRVSFGRALRFLKLAGAFTFDGQYAVVEAIPRFRNGSVVDEVELPYIEMQLVQLLLVANPDDRSAQTYHHASFEINSVALPRKVGNHKTRPLDLADDLVIDSIDVLKSVDSQRIVSGL